MDEKIKTYLNSVKELCPKLPNEALNELAKGLVISEFKPKYFYIEANTIQREIGYVYSGLLNKAKVSIQHPNLTIVEGNVMDSQTVMEVLKEQEAVIQTLGYNGKGNGKPTTFTTDASKIIIEAMN